MVIAEYRAMACDEQGTPFAPEVVAALDRLELDDDGLRAAVRSLVYHYAATCAEERSRLLDRKAGEAQRGA